MPVSISPRRSSSSASGNIYGSTTSSSTTGVSSSTDTSSSRTSSSSGYKSYLDRASSLSKLTSSSSSYSPSSYLGSSSYSSYSPRSFSSAYRSSGTSLTGGSSGVGTYRSTFSSLGSTSSGIGSSYDTTTLGRYGVNRRNKVSDILNKDPKEKALTKKPPSGLEASGGSTKDSKRLSGSSSSSSLARLVATSGLELYEKYSPAHYKPNTQLDSGSRSSLNEAGTDLTEERRATVGDITSNVTLERPRTNRYSRLYSRNDSDEVDNTASTTTIRRSSSGTRSSLTGRLSASNSNSNLNKSDSTEDVPTATFTIRSTRLRKSKVNDEDNKLLRNGSTSDSDSKKKYSTDLTASSSSNSLSSLPTSTAATTNGIDTVAYVKLNKLKISEPKIEIDTNTTSSSGLLAESTSSSNITKSGSSSKLKPSSSHETIATNYDLDVTNDSYTYSSSKLKSDDNNDLEDNDKNKSGKSAALAATINGMRRTGNGSHLATTTAVATSINKLDYSGTQFKTTSSSSSASASPTPQGTSNNSSTTIKKPSSVYSSTNSSYTSSKLTSRTTVKPLVHRSAAIITNSASSALASTSSSSNQSNNNNNNNNGSNSSLNSITNSGNNNMQTSLDQDDIKFIDSDEQLTTGPMMSDRKCEQPPRCCVNHSHSLGITKTRVRPKSTIICPTSSATSSASASSSGNSLVFEKVNNYKYANGSLPSTATSERRNETAIDSNSIRASIEKFNSFSEQKRLPLSSVTLRSHSGSGSTSNLQHHRHSSDLDNCNLRLPSGGGGSLTRTPYRSAGSTAGKVITSIYQNPSASAISSSSSASSTSSRHHHHHHHALSSSPSSTGSLPLKSSKHYVQSEDVAAHSVLSSSVDGDVSKKKLSSISVGLCDNTDDNSVRSSANLRSVLPPASPTTSRYYDRDTSSRSSLLTSSSSHNSTDDNKKSTASDEETEGLCGLRNIGNTCFMNSVIQCLSHTNELTKFLRNYNATKSPTSKDQQILNEFSKLIKEMWTNNVHSVTPMELKRSFSAKHRMYSDYNQQDAQEFLRFFLDSLHGALNTGTKGEHLKIDDNLSDNKKAELTWEWYGRTENSLIRDLFVGQLKSTLRCTTCGNASVTFDPFWDLSVPLPSSSRCKLDACLDLFIREEVLDGDEMPTCSKCQTRRKCTKSFTIQRFPKYLVIHLKRFSETRWSKLSNIVEFPTGERELNMGPYGANANSNIYYSLYAISNHMGSTAGGHYVAICKHPVSKKWHEFNDNLVSDSLSEHHLVSSSAYILFYERA